jgi:hypothetical protein
MTYIYRKNPKKGKTELQEAEANLDFWFSRFIRMRDSDKQGYIRCFTCGGLRYWKQAHCGHGISRKYKATRFDERNCQSQCLSCNIFNEGQKDVFSHNVDVKYGKGTWDKLTVQSRGISKRGVYDYQVMAEHYEKEAMKLAEEKGIQL